MKKKVLVIGAGMGGLSSGCYLGMNDYATEIYEMNPVPGGLCSSWKRKDYTFDGCINWLAGSGPGDPFHDLWTELLDMTAVSFHDPVIYKRVEDEKGKTIDIFTDVSRLENELLSKAPEDKNLIQEFITGIRRFYHLPMPVQKAPELLKFPDYLRLAWTFLPHLGKFRRWMGISVRDFADRCQNPLLKKIFLKMFYPEMSMIFVIWMMIWMSKKSAGYPIGGSAPFVRLLEKKYLDLGGKINYNSKVRDIIIEDHKARGIRLETGKEIEGDLIVSAIDAHDTYFRLLEGKYIDSEMEEIYKSWPVFPSCIQVFLGINHSFPDIPGHLCFPAPSPIKLEPQTTCDDIDLRVFNFDPLLAPEGKTVMSCLFLTNQAEYWEKFRKDSPSRYSAEKDRIAHEVIDALEKRLGNIKKNVETFDVSTPATVIRYTNNWQGSIEGWVLTPRIGFNKVKKVIPGLENFFMAGQWLEPGGGLPTCLLSGRNLTQIICQMDRKPFHNRVERAAD